MVTSVKGPVDNVAVIGGGIAGCLGALLIEKRFPELDLYHVYDPDNSAMSIGLGSLPRFRSNLLSLLELEEKQLLNELNITKKFGNRFEGWNQSDESFIHEFHGESPCSYHLDLSDVIPLLRSNIDSECISKEVEKFLKNDEDASIQFCDGETLQADLVLDARGFPEETDGKELNVIPTNRALLVRGTPPGTTDYTRTIARPYGWIMWVPLQHGTSVGYIYNDEITDDETVRSDLEQVIRNENISLKTEPKLVSFPNFRSEYFYDGDYFRLGNRAAFLDPLEATSLGFLITQLEVLEYIILRHRCSTKRLLGMTFENNLQKIDGWMKRRLSKNAYFIGWFYAQQSHYETDFWKHAEKKFRQNKNNFDRSYRKHFQSNLQRAQQAKSLDDLDKSNNELDPHDEAFAQFGLKSFFEMGTGVGAVQ